MKRKDEIERGVKQELQKRGLAGELDDPLLLNSVGKNANLGGLSMNPEESTLGINNMGGDESSMSIGKMG